MAEHGKDLKVFFSKFNEIFEASRNFLQGRCVN